jgi:hypothetical protein
MTEYPACGGNPYGLDLLWVLYETTLGCRQKTVRSIRLTDTTWRQTTEGDRNELTRTDHGAFGR